jgi:hypothetical protein
LPELDGALDPLGDMPVVPRAPSFIIWLSRPPVVRPSMESPVVVLLAAGPPDCELPPAVLPPACANAAVPLRARVKATAIVLNFIGRILLFMPHTPIVRAAGRS